MKHRKYISGLILSVTLTLVTACTWDKDYSNNIAPDTNQETESEEEQETNVNTMEEFNTLISGETNLRDIITFMKENVSKVTSEEATKMILSFEELQADQRTIIEEEKYLDEAIQRIFQQIDGEEIDINNVDSIKDEIIKNLVVEAKESGYKIETAEGYYFPVINYSYYKQFSSYATPDIKDYIDIMAVESDKLFAKDAALLISWDELVKRSLSLERYLNQYPESQKSEYIQKVYDNYVFITMNGLDNTPLYDYDSKKMNNDAKIAYTHALTQSINSEYLKRLGEFMLEAEKNGFKQTKDPNRYEVSGIVEADELDRTFDLLKTALMDNNKDAFTDYIAYPIKVKIDGEKVEIKNKEEFIDKFDVIMSEDLRNVFIDQKVEDLFVNQYGIMVGDGQFWISQIEGSKHKFSIYAINN